MLTTKLVLDYAVTHNPLECQPEIVAHRQSFLHAEAGHPSIAELNNQLFTDGVLRQRRIDVFNQRENDILFPLSILYWGFPTNMHGIGTHLYDSYEKVRDISTYIRMNQDITRATFMRTVVPMLNECYGLGLSFFSKLFYYSGLKIDGARCTINDKKVRGAIAGTVCLEFTALRQYNSGTYSSYVHYVQEVEKLANQFGCTPDCVEYALFVGRAQ